MYNSRGDHETFANNQRSELSWLLVVGGASVLDSQFQLQEQTYIFPEELFNRNF